MGESKCQSLNHSASELVLLTVSMIEEAGYKRETYQPMSNTQAG